MSVIGKIVKKQSSWTQADLYDSVFTLRMILATVLGVMFGLGSMEGLYAFLTYVIDMHHCSAFQCVSLKNQTKSIDIICRFLTLNFMVPNTWFSYQMVDPVQYEDEKHPLTMEGYGQALSLFMLCWVTSYASLRPL